MCGGMDEHEQCLIISITKRRKNPEKFFYLIKFECFWIPQILKLQLKSRGGENFLGIPFSPANYLFWRLLGSKKRNKINEMDALDIKINSISAKKGSQAPYECAEFNRNGLSINSRCCVNRFSSSVSIKRVEILYFLCFRLSSACHWLISIVQWDLKRTKPWAFLPYLTSVCAFVG
jgi:hypothetical protein